MTMIRPTELRALCLDHQPHLMYISWIALLALFLACVAAQGLTSEQIETVQQRLAEGATHRPVVHPAV